MAFEPLNKSSFETIPQPETKKSGGIGSVLNTGVLNPISTNLGIGAIKGAVGTLQNIGNLVLSPLNKGLNAVGIKTPQTGFSKEQLQTQGTAQGVGKFAEQVAEFALPSSLIGKTAKGASLATKALKIGERAITSGAVATAQEGKVGQGTAIATGAEIAFPVVGALAKGTVGVFGRLFKGLGSGLSGVSEDTIANIVKNPEVSQTITKELQKKGQTALLEKNAQTIVNGIANVRKQARSAFGEGVSSLKAEDINPSKFRKAVQPVLDAVGSIKIGKTNVLRNVEFSEPKNLKRASSLIDDLSRVKLDGFSLRKLLGKIEDSAYKVTGTDPERLSFNVFIRDLADGVKLAINESTDKLQTINKKFSTDMQIVDNMERIFGGIKFKNAEEIGKVAQKLETLFAQKGLNPRDIDNFLTRIGVNPETFRTGESIRQISNKTAGANSIGTSFGEVFRALTSAVVTPNAVKNLAIITGISEKILNPILKDMTPVARATFVRGLLGLQTEPQVEPQTQ